MTWHSGKVQSIKIGECGPGKIRGTKECHQGDDTFVRCISLYSAGMRKGISKSLDLSLYLYEKLKQNMGKWLKNKGYERMSSR